MAASRRAPWMRMTQGSPECLSTRRALVSVGRDRVSPALVAGAQGRVLSPPPAPDQNVNSSLNLFPPPNPAPARLAVSRRVTGSLAREGSGAITGLRREGVSHSQRRAGKDSNDAVGSCPRPKQDNTFPLVRPNRAVSEIAGCWLSSLQHHLFRC